ncbi:MAG: hypothetical protein K2J65_06950 [Duncaniella sp.]|nr:hypothetical protein [Duncaniella sp.]
MKTHKYRISDAAVGKILTRIMEMTRSAEISSEQFHDTMFAALNYIEGEVEPSKNDNINREKWQSVKELIDKSARRSKAARERAARRRQSLITSSHQEVGESFSENQSPHPCASADMTVILDNPDKAVAAKSERERLERLSREYDKVCRMSYW